MARGRQVPGGRSGAGVEGPGGAVTWADDQRRVADAYFVLVGDGAVEREVDAAQAGLVQWHRVEPDRGAATGRDHAGFGVLHGETARSQQRHVVGQVVLGDTNANAGHV